MSTDISTKYIIEHMNSDHSDSILSYAKYYSNIHNAKSATLTDINYDGITLNINTTRQHNIQKFISFPSKITSNSQYKQILIDMSKESITALSKQRSSYFRTANVPITIFILFALYINYCVAYNKPLPHGSLEFIRTYSVKYLGQTTVQYIFISAVITHIIEALIAYRLCKKKGINNITTQLKWIIQTSLVGYPSLGFLVNLSPK